MSEYVEFSAKNTSAALSQAVEHFALPLSRLEVDILSTGSGGILGMFGKKARIRVRPANADSVKDTVAEILNNGRAPKAETPEAAPATLSSMPSLAGQTAVSEALPDQPERDKDTEDLDVAGLISQAEEVIARLCQPLAHGLELESAYKDNQLTIIIKCPEPGVLIGRRAQILDALQYLGARIISHRFGRSISLVLDVENYRSRQLKQLEETVLKLAEKALAHNRPYTLGPLGTPERRLVHRVLKDKPLQTYSKGHGELKRMVIAPPSTKQR